jgi:hypothetical protein
MATIGKDDTFAAEDPKRLQITSAEPLLTLGDFKSNLLSASG